MPIQYLTDGDKGFVGLNSRENPSSLKPGILSVSENFRLNRGIAKVRDGLKRLFFKQIDEVYVGLEKLKLRYVTVFRNERGEDMVIFICKDRLFSYNTVTDALSIDRPILFPNDEKIGDDQPCDAFQALGNLYILRGYSALPLVWDGDFVVSVTSGFPKSSHGIYHSNRAIVQISSDEISVSRYLDFTTFRQLDVFKINDGSNDEIVAIAPWVLNEAVVFMRNRIYYASVGSGAYTYGDAILPEDCYVKVLATDIGCLARGTIVQAGGGIMFLSDHGVYAMKPESATTPEGMRVGVLGEPISADIEDVMLRLNKDKAKFATAAYQNNRYYLAIPVDGEETVIVSDGGGGGGGGGPQPPGVFFGDDPDTPGNPVFNDNPYTPPPPVTPPPVIPPPPGPEFIYIPDDGGIVWTDEENDLPSEGEEEFSIYSQINILIPYRFGYYYQKGDTIWIDGVDYVNSNGQTETIRGEFTVTGVQGYNGGTHFIVTFNVPYFNSQVNTIPTTYTVTIKKVSTGNNTLLVYNFINKMWESIDNFDTNFNIKHIVFGLREGQRRLFIVDENKGMFLVEELSDGDEFGALVTDPILDDVFIPFLLEESVYLRHPARGKLVTRAYNFDNLDDKRYSSVELDIHSPPGGRTYTNIETENPDQISLVDYYKTSTKRQSSRDVPIRKFGSSAKIVVETFGSTPSIRSIYITAVDPGNNIKSSE